MTKSETRKRGERRTVATVKPVSGEERIGELARMLSGLSTSASARAHAEELLSG